MIEMIELTASELDIVAGGQTYSYNAFAKAEIKQSNHAYVAVGNVSGGVASSYSTIGSDNNVTVDESNSNSGNASASAST